MNLINYLIHRVIQQLCHGCNKAKEVRHNKIQQKDSNLKQKSRLKTHKIKAYLQMAIYAKSR
jgi:hypothetical protein